MGQWFSVTPGPAARASPRHLLEMMARTTAVGAQQLFAGDNAGFVVLKEDDTTNTVMQAVVPICSTQQNNLLRCRVLAPTPSVSDSVDLGWE